MTSGALAGVRVVESSAFIAAPLCGLTLAQQGADVIRIDMIGGGIDYRRMPVVPGGRSIYWTSLNKGKRSIAIDIRNPAGREIIQALVASPGPDGGILLTNVASDFLAYDVLTARRPDIISCTIEGNHDGTTAVDYTVNCATGYPMITGNGSPERPVNHSLPIWDVATAYQAAFALVSAIAVRSTTGNGQALRIALSDVAFATMSHLGILTEAAVGLPEREPLGNDIYGAFGRDFATADRRRVMVAAISTRQWQALMTACGLRDVIAIIEEQLGLRFDRETDRFAARDIIGGLVRRWIEARTFAAVAAAFDAANVCWGPYQSIAELVRNDPRVSTCNPLFAEIDTPGVGRHIAAGSVVRSAEVAAGRPLPAPLLGQHTDEVLADVLGLSGAEIGRLHDRGVVAGPDKDPLTPATTRPRSFDQQSHGHARS